LFDLKIQLEFPVLFVQVQVVLIDGMTELVDVLSFKN
jgi:hypothetical protein